MTSAPMTAEPPPSTAAPGPVAFQDVLASMAEVDRLKSREELLAAEADLPARVAAVTAKLKEVYARQGVEVSDDVIARGVEQFFSQRLVFQPPPPSLAASLAGLWIHRWRVIRITAAVALVGALLMGGVYFGVVVPARAARAKAVASARAAIASARAQLLSTEHVATAVFTHAEQALDRTAASAENPEIPQAVRVAAAKLAQDRTEYAAHIKRADDALAPYAAATAINDTTLDAANDVAREVLALEKQARTDVDVAGSLWHQVSELQAQRAALATAWGRLDQVGVAAALRPSAEQIYARGLAIVSALGPASEVQAAVARLDGLADSAAALRALPARIKAAAAEARSASEDPLANQQIDGAERGALAAAEAGDRRGAETLLASLHDIAAQLNATYVLRIVNRPGEYTRLWRYPRGRSNVRNYYVVVEAVTPEGQPVAFAIRSEEDNSTARVSKWAERVDEQTYESVGEDKRDDGIVQNNVFAEKAKGHLAPAYRLGPKARGADVNAGRIYRWEYRG